VDLDSPGGLMPGRPGGRRQGSRDPSGMPLGERQRPAAAGFGPER
jgi:hypothetical protein